MKEQSTKYVVKKSSAGLGLFAVSEFKRGDFIIEYTGELISENEANARGGKYLFVINKELVIDGKKRENISRYINHACKPNAEAERDEDDKKIRIFARRKIIPGDEVTYDYGKDYWAEYIEPSGCRCNSCLSTGKL